MPLIYSSTNLEKLAEVTRLGACYGVEVVDLKRGAGLVGVGMPPEVRELESSYEGNALLKAKAYAQWFGRPCMADDSGLEISELGGLPGVYTARYGVLRVSDSLLPDRKYDASLVCCVAYVEPSGRSVSVTASLPGIVAIPRDMTMPSSSLPYSHFFMPSGRGESLAITLREDPTFLSHRGRAFRSLVQSIGMP